ncbi:hypothetical protein CITRIK5_10256 [Citricoccus sp. K5]|nr:hypothetical protein CITRIK5_10256 [Citricoccus sp. K5]
MKTRPKRQLCRGNRLGCHGIAGGAGADGKRFELLVRGYRTLVFKTSSFGRSDNHPRRTILKASISLPVSRQFMAGTVPLRQLSCLSPAQVGLLQTFIHNSGRRCLSCPATFVE